MERRRSKRIIVAVLGLLLLLGGSLALKRWCASTWMFERNPPVLEMSGENEIRVAMDRAIADAAEARDLNQYREQENYIREIAYRLENDWPGFRVDGYHPSGYSSQHLLGELIGTLARTVSLETHLRGRELRVLLYDLRPREADLETMWRKYLQLYKLDPDAQPSP